METLCERLTKVKICLAQKKNQNILVVPAQVPSGKQKEHEL